MSHLPGEGAISSYTPMIATVKRRLWLLIHLRLKPFWEWEKVQYPFLRKPHRHNMLMTIPRGWG